MTMCRRYFVYPQSESSFLQKWNKIFVLSRVIALYIDPIFFYIPVIDAAKNCIDLDNKLMITACVLRSFTDVFYVLDIILKFRTGFIYGSPTPPSSNNVFWEAKLVADSRERRRYSFSYFLVDILAVLPLPQMFGASWYLLSIERKDSCWRDACGNKARCDPSSLYCGVNSPVGGNAFLDASCPLTESDTTPFDFGIYRNALKSGVVESTNFLQKLSYCLWWGLKSLSSLGQNLETSTFVGEIYFAVSISVFGLVLFALLVGNMQTYLQSYTVASEEMMRAKRRDAEQWDVEQWMSRQLLPEKLRERIRQYEQYKWRAKRGFDEHNLISNLPKDLRRDIKRHFCLSLLMRVPMFEKMDEQLLDTMCHHLKRTLYTEESYITRKGDPVDEMLFIMRGKLLTVTTNGGRTGFFNSEYLKAGDFCGEELVTWALDPHSSSNLPTSTRTVRALTAVEAFSLVPDDLKCVASQFRRVHSKQLRHTFRFYSPQWRTWGACFIQVAWRRYCKKKLEESLNVKENRLKDALAKVGGTSLSLGATIYAARFVVNVLRAVRHRALTISPERVPQLMLQKPAEPDFSMECRAK